jgi:hypothetical protein
MMIDRSSNKVAITSQDRLQPMDKWEDYPDGDASDGVFLLLHLWVLPSRWLILLRKSPSSLSLACGWPLGVNGSLFANGGASRTLGLKILRVQGNGGRTDPQSGPGRQLGPTGPGPSRPGLVVPSLPWVLRWLCTSPLPFAWFWWCHPRVQDGGSPCMKFGILRFNPRGCSFVELRSLPPLEVVSSNSWTRTRLRKCSFELVVNPFFMSMFSCINTTLPNACT